MTVYWGTSGNDIMSDPTGQGNTFFGNAGNDTINARQYNDTVYGGDNNDSITGYGSSLFLSGDDGNDYITYFDMPLLSGNSYSNLLGGTGNDTIVGTATDMSSHPVTMEIYGGAGNDSLSASCGGGGNQQFPYGCYADLFGGTGDDIYLYNLPAGSGPMIGINLIENAGEGTDTVQSYTSFSLGVNFENLTLVEGYGNINGTGNSVNNTIIGNSGNNSINGGAGNDTLLGNAGNDTIDGGAGTDFMNGGLGNDTYYVDNSLDKIHEDPYSGTDSVYSSVSYTIIDNGLVYGLANVPPHGASIDPSKPTKTNSATTKPGSNSGFGGVVNSVSGDTVENLYLTGNGNINGTANFLSNTLVGNSGNNILYGLQNNDTIDGGAGADTMYGGTENDTYYVDNVFDSVVENANEGTDTVYSYIDNYLRNNVENLTLLGSAIEGDGNNANNTIIGNSQNNLLVGFAGNDTLLGGVGDDTYSLNLISGAGNSGIDLITDTSGTDRVNFYTYLDVNRVAFFKDSSGNLSCDYGTNVGTDKAVISSWNNTANQIERFDTMYEYQDDDWNTYQVTSYLSNNDINTALQNMTAYATSHGITLNSVADVKNNSTLMSMFMNTAWHTSTIQI